MPFVNQNGKTGVVVPPADACALGEAINELLTSAQVRQNYGQNAQERVRGEFTKERMADEILRIYNEVF